jgi:hypothetical protein
MHATSGWLKGLLTLTTLEAFGLVALAGCSEPEPTHTDSPTATLVPLPTATRQEIEVPFETIERMDSSGTGQLYEEREPKLVILTEAGEYEALGNTVSVEAQMQLLDIDYSDYLVIAVFQGWRPSMPTPQSGVEVHTISLKENTLTIHAHYYEPVEGYEARDVETSPYHLVKLRRREDVQGEVEFVLKVDGAVVSRQTRHLP